MSYPISKKNGYSSVGDRMRNIIIKVGATPNDIISAIESNSFPNSDSRPPKRANLPSRESQMTPKRMNQTAWVNNADSSIGSFVCLLEYNAGWLKNQKKISLQSCCWAASKYDLLRLYPHICADVFFLPVTTYSWLGVSSRWRTVSK